MTIIKSRNQVEEIRLRNFRAEREELPKVLRAQRGQVDSVSVNGGNCG